ncbi:hypothetical protein MKEN_00732600 [Mycena kentingensis (nom. inval.)]|nr:hypothetical protein MKEN_00732600 [Mycena kentingensis (nom. inval.)]
MSPDGNDDFFPFPAMGSFVTYTLDPTACVDPETRSDSIARQALEEMQVGEYVGLLGQTVGFYQPDAEYNAYKLHLIQTGSPDDLPAEGVSAEMFHPLADSQPSDTDSSSKHLPGRPPLVPLPSLPLAEPPTGAFLSVNWTLLARSKTHGTAHKLLPMSKLDTDEYLDFCVRYQIDEAQQGANLCKLEQQPDRRWREMPLPPQRSSRPEDYLSDALIDEMLPDLDLDFVSLATGTFSYDLTRARTLASPAGLFKELEQITQIVAESKARRQAQYQEQVDRTNALNAEYDEKTYARTEAPFLARGALYTPLDSTNELSTRHANRLGFNLVIRGALPQSQSGRVDNTKNSVGSQGAPSPEPSISTLS